MNIEERVQHLESNFHALAEYVLSSEIQQLEAVALLARLNPGFSDEIKKLFADGVENSKIKSKSIMAALDELKAFPKIIPLFKD